MFPKMQTCAGIIFALEGRRGDSGVHILGTLMSEKIIALVVQFVIHVISAGGYAGIAALIVLNSSGIPIPSELIMPFSGYLTYLGRFNLFLVATAGMVGCNAGSAIAYWIGAKGGRPLVERCGKWVLMSHHDLDRMSWFFERYGSIAILAGRMLPLVQTYVAFPAGIGRMPRLRFHIYTSVGSWIWYFCLAWAGMKLGERWNSDPRFQEIFHRFHLAVELTVVALVVWFVWAHVRRNREQGVGNRD
jgi:membrane protein DedA with SNARE-associated domain